MPIIKFDKDIPAEEAFLHLPPGYNERAFANLRKHSQLKYADRNYSELSKSLFFSFLWRSTKEGFTFWERVFRYYEDDPSVKTLPELPND